MPRNVLTGARVGNEDKAMVEPLRITSRNNPRIKQAALLRQGRERRRSGRFLIDGARETLHAIQAGIIPIEAYLCDPPAASPECRQAIQQLRERHTEMFVVSAEVFGKLAYGERNEGLIVVAEAPRRSLSSLEVPGNAFIAVVEGVEKPGNIGAILRSADAAGVDAVVIADGGTDLFNPNTIRASLGTVFRANVRASTVAEVTAWLCAHKRPLFAARPDARELYTSVDFSHGAALILGSEARGLSDAWRAADVIPIRLPMRGVADSLNVSAAAAVLFYEALRQRGDHL